MQAPPGGDSNPLGGPSRSAPGAAGRYCAFMRELGEHGVVLGASMGGLVAGKALAQFYRGVPVLDRDELPEDGGARRAVPQGRHVHALLAGGGRTLETLFPGFLADLEA